MKKSFWAPITIALAAYLVLPLPGLSAPLSQKIEKKREQVAQKDRQEGVLTTTIQGYSNRIDGLKGEINATRSRLGRVQTSLDEQKASCSRCVTAWRWPATGWSASGTTWPPRAGCWPPAWWRSTRPTPRTP